MKRHIFKPAWSLTLISLCVLVASASAQETTSPRSYEKITAEASALTESEVDDKQLERELIAHMEEIFGVWYGTT